MDKNYKVLWSDLDEKKKKVTIHLERTDTGALVDVVVDSEKGETWEAAMDAACAP